VPHSFPPRNAVVSPFFLDGGRIGPAARDLVKPSESNRRSFHPSIVKMGCTYNIYTYTYRVKTNIQPTSLVVYKPLDPYELLDVRTDGPTRTTRRGLLVNSTRPRLLEELRTPRVSS
jgi:hypothetical protein